MPNKWTRSAVNQRYVEAEKAAVVVERASAALCASILVQNAW